MLRKVDWEFVDQCWRLVLTAICVLVAFAAAVFPGFAKKTFVQACQKCVPKRASEVSHDTDEAGHGQDVHEGVGAQLP